jgi:hypothetical protein
MKQQLPHKIILIALLLVVFALPFYIFGLQSAPLTYDDYTLSAAVVKGQSTDDLAPVPGGNAAGLSQAAGHTFIGDSFR